MSTGEQGLPLPRPGKVVCCGLNYADHITEMGRELPAHPTLFAKHADTLLADGADIVLPAGLQVDWEAELAVVVGTEIRGVPRRQGEERARALLDQLGLDGFADNYPATLSGGMRQRVALARTLVNDPDVLLLDEPFAALDFQTKLLIEGDTIRLVRDGQRSVLLITHDIEEAVSIADRVLVLSQRPTRIKASYQVSLDCARDDMIAARQSRGFSDYVRRIWTDLDVVHA